MQQALPLSQAMGQMQCNKADHKNQLISLICMHKTCEGKRMLCVDCRKDHEAHSTFYFSFADLEKVTGSQQDPNLTAQLDKITRQSDKIVKDALNEIQSLKDILNALINSQRQGLNMEQFRNDHLRDQIPGLAAAQKMANQLFSIVEVNGKEITIKREFEEKIKQLDQLMGNQLAGCADELIEKIREMKEHIAQVSGQSLELNQQNKIEEGNELSISTSWKGRETVINGLSIKNISTNWKASPQMVLCTPNVGQLAKNNKFEFKFKVEKCNNFCSLGICLLAPARKLQFQHNGQCDGMFMVQQDGVLLHGTSKEQNRFESQVKFASGDTVQFSIDFSSKTMVIKNGNKEVVMKDIPMGEKLYACAVLALQDDEVKLLK